MIENYKKEFEDFRVGLEKESKIVRQAASRAVKDLLLLRFVGEWLKWLYMDVTQKLAANDFRTLHEVHACTAGLKSLTTSATAVAYSSPTQSAIWEDLNLSIAQYSLFGSLLTFGAMIGAITSGKIVDFFGRTVSAIRQEMKEKGMNRIPGCSWIEIKSQIHVFVTRDQILAQKDQIYDVLRLFLWNEAQESEDILGP